MSGISLSMKVSTNCLFDQSLDQLISHSNRL
uniref:Uncharacterized protein n=1 Tax=Rhizophora mucronata TaxID=61149 RepID=A0A2P2L2I2_RHIMU